MGILSNIRLRGIRAIIPTGYVLGRGSSGNGDVELLDMKRLGAQLTTAGSVSGPGALGTGSNPTFEFLGFSAAGPFGSHQFFDLSMAPRAVLFPSVINPGKDKAICQFAPTSDASFVLTYDRVDYLAHGTSVLATVTILAGQKVGTVTYGSPHTFAFGDIPWIVFPAIPDTTLAEVQVLFCGDAK